MSHYEMERARNATGDRWERLSNDGLCWIFAEPAEMHPDAWVRRSVEAPSPLDAYKPDPSSRNGWVKFSEREPSSYPVLAWSPDWHAQSTPVALRSLEGATKSNAYWMAYELPPVPTQEERDRDAFEDYCGAFPEPIPLEARKRDFLAGVAHGRKEGK